MMSPVEDNTNPYLDDPDVQLMLEFIQGNKASFEALMRKYFPRLLNFIYRYVGNRQIAEDLTQEVFIKVHNAASKYSPQSKFQTWIFTIAKNMSLNELRRLKRPMISIDESIDLGTDHVQRQFSDETTEAPDKNILEDEKVQAIRTAINDLPKNQRMAVVLRRYENMSYEEIALTMNTSEKAVKSLLNRSKENLKIRLQKFVNNDNN